MNFSKSPGKKRIGIIVLGMHRSGTSVLTRIINILGAELPVNCLGANESNATGHWEPRSLIWLHEHMLHEGGSQWDDWRSFEFARMPADRQAHFANEVSRLLREEFDSAPIFVLKEPRISRFVPLYTAAFDTWGVQPKFVLTNRNPLEVAASLCVRDKITREYALLIWLRHELDAERATRGYARTFVSYEGMLNDTRPIIDKIVNLVGDTAFALSEASDNEIDRFLSSRYRHHQIAIEELGSETPVLKWVSETYAALKRLEVDANDSRATSVLDRLNAEFDALSVNFGTVFVSESNTRIQILRERHEEEVHSLTHTVDALRQHIVDLRRELIDSVSSNNQLAEQLQEANLMLNMILKSKTYRLSRILKRIYRVLNRPQ
ncbi:sulfotransferase family protein [Brucella intermedia]|uniref:sulfotransferase family protein n=1 Tax=Brucella intermedia TaxID=94625 RepID=UPI00235E8467|nr:hypothetical protein [Brucella intermedia]